MIAQLPELVSEASHAADADDPGYEILHRPAVLDDPDEAAAFAALIGDDADRQRREDAKIAQRVGDGEEALTRDDAAALLRVINEGRLVLAARAGAFDRGPGWEREVRRDPSLAAVAWLGYVQNDLVKALMRR